MSSSSSSHRPLDSRPAKKSRSTFDIGHVQDLVTAGEWVKVEQYLLDFTGIFSNEHSTAMFLAIRKQKFYEALKRNDKKEAKEILTGELVVFFPSHPTLNVELTELLVSKDIRELEKAKTDRNLLFLALKEEITVNPLLKDKLVSLEKLPTKQLHVLSTESIITAMEFQPHNDNMLLVGTITGELKFWNIISGKCRYKPFELKIDENLSKFTKRFQDFMSTTNKSLSVSSLSWSSQGGYIGVGFSESLVQVYEYDGPKHLLKRAEVEAHEGPVNDLVFGDSHNGEICLFTCGDDKLVKVWSVTGVNLYTFEGHKVAVLSLCFRQIENFEYIFSADNDGIIKAWCRNKAEIVEYDASCSNIRIFQNTEKNRLFSGGSQLGSHILVEWDTKERSIKTTFIGLTSGNSSVIHFDAGKSFLAAAEQGAITFWNMDCSKVLESIPFMGKPCSLRLSVGEEILAASNDTGFLYILATTRYRSMAASN